MIDDELKDSLRLTSNFNFPSYTLTSGELKEDRIINKESRDPFRYEKNIRYEDFKYIPSEDDNKVNLLINYNDNSKFSHRQEHFETAPIRSNRYQDEEKSNINQELTYYKNIIDNMQAEIMKLNSKLNELDGRNNSYVYIPKIENLEKNIDNLKVQIDNNLKNKEDRLYKLEKDKDLLFNKNMEIEKEINRLDSIVYKNESVKSNMTKLKKELNKPPSTRSNSKGSVRKPRDINSGQKSVKSKSPTIKQTPSKSSIKSSAKSSIKTSAKTSNTSRSKSKPKAQSVKKQKPINKELEEKITDLERIVEYLTDQLRREKTSSRGKDHLRLELEIWKTRTEALTKKYLENLSALKNQLVTNKSSFLDQLKILQTNFNTQVNNLKIQYHTNIEKNEHVIKRMRRENEDMRKKVMKVKDLII